MEVVRRNDFQQHFIINKRTWPDCVANKTHTRAHTHIYIYAINPHSFLN